LFARKLIRPFGDFAAADIFNEIRALDRICIHNIPNIVKVIGHDMLPQSSFYYIDMELCALNLDNYIQKKWPLNIQSWYFEKEINEIVTVWGIMTDISRGLTFIHSLEEVHRDVKPQNGISLLLLLTCEVLYSIDEDAWKLADFGFTAPGTSSVCVPTQTSRGTPSYRAPELLRDNPFYTNKSDIWALGCILFELVTSKKAFSADWAVVQYYLSIEEFAIPTEKYTLPNMQRGTEARDIENIVQGLLHREHSKRPPAVYLTDLFKHFCQLAAVTSPSGGICCASWLAV
jgi:serine/threonine protein kinase